MPYAYKKFRQNPFTSLRVIRRTDRQTDRTKNITSFFGGGKNSCALFIYDLCNLHFICKKSILILQLRIIMKSNLNSQSREHLFNEFNDCSRVCQSAITITANYIHKKKECA